jgi:hypothetical protein
LGCQQGDLTRGRDRRTHHHFCSNSCQSKASQISKYTDFSLGESILTMWECIIRSANQQTWESARRGWVVVETYQGPSKYRWHLHKGKGGGEGSSTGACRYVDLIGKLQEIIYTSPCSADTTELVLAFIWQVLCPFRNHAIYLCHREFAPWQNGSVVSSMVTQCKCSQV